MAYYVMYTTIRCEITKEEEFKDYDKALKFAEEKFIDGWDYVAVVDEEGGILAEYEN